MSVIITACGFLSNVESRSSSQDEEGTIENSISTAKHSHFKPHVILVDAYSTDNTAFLAKKPGAIVIQQPTQTFPAKGIAMKAGLNEAYKRSANIIVFLDADIKNVKCERES